MGTFEGTTGAAGPSLRTRFLLVVLLIFFVGAAASYATIRWFSHDVVRTLSAWFAEKSVLYEKSRVLQMLLPEIVLTRKMASSPLVKDWVRHEDDPRLLARAIAELEDYRRFYRSRSYFLAIAKSGHYYFDDDRGRYDRYQPRYTLSPKNPRDDWFYETLREVKSYRLNVNRDRHLGITRVWINTVLRVGGKPLAVMGTGLDLTAFIASVVRSTRPGVTNMLLDGNGAIQAHRNVSVIDFSSITRHQLGERQSTIYTLIDDEADRVAFRRALAGLVSGRTEVRSLSLTIQGKRQVAGIAYIPQVKWFVVTLTYPKSVQSMHYVTAVAGVLVVSLALVLLAASLAFDRMVLRRVDALDATARRIAEGDYGAAAGGHGTDELARLGHTLHDMAERISAHTTELESQIADRTATLERMAYADYLTGLLNRRGMADRLMMEKTRLSRDGGHIGVLVLDMDNFKSINDRYGHEAGDQVLKHCANAIREVMRSYDLCSRWGGEEFLVIVPGVRSQKDLLATAERLREAVAGQSLSLQGEAVSLTASIGCYLASAADTVDTMIRIADDALYQAKQQGRNRVIMTGGDGDGGPAATNNR